eukprot:1620593-Pleurochrysis_carterae.AAC.3
MQRDKIKIRSRDQSLTWTGSHGRVESTSVAEGGNGGAAAAGPQGARERGTHHAATPARFAAESCGVNEQYGVEDVFKLGASAVDRTVFNRSDCGA